MIYSFPPLLSTHNWKHSCLLQSQVAKSNPLIGTFTSPEQPAENQRNVPVSVTTTNKSFKLARRVHILAFGKSVVSAVYGPDLGLNLTLTGSPKDHNYKVTQPLPAWTCILISFKELLFSCSTLYCLCHWLICFQSKQELESWLPHVSSMNPELADWYAVDFILIFTKNHI